MQSSADLIRFVEAYNQHFNTALQELQNGLKEGHWMYALFPQLSGLGSSSKSKQFALADLAEAEDFLSHPLLGEKLIELAKAFCSIEDREAEDVLGYPDVLKMQSSMTLFCCCANAPEVFGAVLSKFYCGEHCPFTLDACSATE